MGEISLSGLCMSPSFLEDRSRIVSHRVGPWYFLRVRIGESFVSYGIPTEFNLGVSDPQQLPARVIHNDICFCGTLDVCLHKPIIKTC